MRKSLLKLLGAIAALTLSTCVSAIGMGGIDVASALGQPLKAEIELVSVKRTDKTSLAARLASPDVYKGAGLEYPYGNKFSFQIENRADGKSYLKVSSAQPVNDPFISLLVELSWSSGRLLREYTFLLDPPGYAPEQPKQARVEAVAPAVQDASQETMGKPAERVAAEPSAGKMEEEAAVSVEPAAAESAAKSVVAGNITVKRGDTLSKIAMQNKPADVTLERMLVALYRANAEQFDGKNMNRIRAGKILRLPDQGELTDVTQREATREIRAHVADWNTYRQKLASAAAIATQSQDAQQVATGKIASSVADKAPVAKESAKEVLKLSKGEAPGDQAEAGAMAKPASAEDKKDAVQEEAIAKAKATEEEQARAALLEKNLKDMERLAELKAETAASGIAVTSEVKPKPVAKPKPQPVVEPVVPPPSLVDQVLGEPLYLAGGMAVLLGLGGLGFIMVKRRRTTSVAATEKRGEDIGAVTGRIAAPTTPSPDTGDFTGANEARTGQTDQQHDEVDPISEADLFLNFGRDAQAEEILKEALRNTPDNHQIHLRLLGIYANRKDVNAFSDIARRLQDSGDEEAWQQAAAMGRKIEPNNPMYGSTGTIEDADSATMHAMAPGIGATTDLVVGEEAAEETAAAPEVDFDLGASAEEPAAMPEEQDFVSSTEKTAILTPGEMAAAQAAQMDFDVTSTQPPKAGAVDEGEQTVLSNSDDLVFDVTSTQPSKIEGGGGSDDLVFDVTSDHSTPAAAEPEKAAPADDGGMEFILDFPVEKAAEKAAPEEQPAEEGLAGISLNLDDIGMPAEPTAENKDEHWHDVATKLDLAKAYQEMGDVTGAREILEEVLREGDEGQREAAQSMLDQLG